MITHEILSEYAGARVIRLIGRETEMSRIRDSIKASRPQSALFYIAEG